MEVITRTERRRTYSEAEKAAVVAEASVPGVTVREVSRRLGIAESLIFNWRSAQRKAEGIASEPLQFITYGVVVDTASEPSMALMPQTTRSRITNDDGRFSFSTRATTSSRSFESKWTP